VKDGAITGATTKEHPAKGNNFLIAKQGGTNLVVADFELRLSYKIVANNSTSFGDSGVQYRSKVMEQGKFGPIVGGYQADFEAGTTFSGINYEERGRGIVAGWEEHLGKYQCGGSAVDREVVVLQGATGPRGERSLAGCAAHYLGA